MIGGMWMPELITLAGATPLVTQPGEHAPTLSLEQLAQLDPDVVLIKPCGFALERTQVELPLLRDVLPWQSWRAVQNGRVYLADGNAYFNRPARASWSRSRSSRAARIPSSSPTSAQARSRGRARGPRPSAACLRCELAFSRARGNRAL